MAARKVGVSALDHALGKSDGYISNVISRGSTPRDHNLDRIAAVLAVNPDWLRGAPGQRDDAELVQLPLEERAARFDQGQAQAKDKAMADIRALSSLTRYEVLGGSSDLERPIDSSNEGKEACADLVWLTAQSYSHLKVSHAESNAVVDLLALLWPDLKSDQEALEQTAYLLLRAAAMVAISGQEVNRTSILKAFVRHQERPASQIYLQATIEGESLLVFPTTNRHHPFRLDPSESVIHRLADELNKRLGRIPYDENPESAVFALIQITKRFHAKLEVSQVGTESQERFVVSEIKGLAGEADPSGSST